MNTLVVFTACLAAASAQLIASPYAGAYNGLYAGAYAGNLPWAYGRGYGAPYALNAYAAPAPIAAPLAAAPAPLPAPLTAPSSQFQAQDEFGNLNYGYSNINSAKQEVGNTYGGVTGSYSYVDANGIVQRADYIADAAGFRVQATNLPVAPAVPVVAPLEAPVFNAVGPAPVQDTPEVAAEKAKFAEVYAKEASREKREAESYFPYSALPYGGYPYNNYGYNLGYNYAGAFPYALNAYAAPAATYAAPIAAPVAAYAAPAAVVPSAPATAEATLTKIKLNPGHALFYRVD